MPEGHTIHRYARDHEKLFLGRTLAVSSPQGRFENAAALDGRSLMQVEACGKHLFYVFSGAEPRRVHIHLGLYGKFYRHALPVPAPRPTCRMRLVSDEAAVDLVGPTACKLIDDNEQALLLSRIGPDPLHAREGDKERWIARLARMRAAIGAALLDQAVISGIGNIFRAEALFACGLHPEQQACKIEPQQLAALWDTLTNMLERGVREGRIVTAVPEKNRRTPVPRSRAFMVYKRDTCRRCDAKVRRWLLRARFIYACEVCQTPAVQP